VVRPGNGFAKDTVISGDQLVDDATELFAALGGAAARIAADRRRT
jgi:hypothetical protein